MLFAVYWLGSQFRQNSFKSGTSAISNDTYTMSQQLESNKIPQTSGFQDVDFGILNSVLIFTCVYSTTNGISMIHQMPFLASCLITFKIISKVFTPSYRFTIMDKEEFNLFASISASVFAVFQAIAYLYSCVPPTILLYIREINALSCIAIAFSVVMYGSLKN